MMLSSAAPNVAQFFFARKAPFNFAVAVSKLSEILQKSSINPVLLSWDQDDIVTMELGHLRVFLNYAEADLAVPAAHLTIGLTCLTGTDRDRFALGGTRISRILVARIAEFLEPDLITWADVQGPMTADVIENMAHQMFRSACEIPASEKSATDSLRKPVSENDAAIFFGRMSKDIPRLAIKRETDVLFVPPGARRMPSWISRSALGALIALIIMPIGLAVSSTDRSILRDRAAHITVSASKTLTP